MCLDDIQRIINSNPRRLQKCPICRVLINSYGCNGNIVNVASNQIGQPNIIITNNEINNPETYIPPITNDEINNPETYIPPNSNNAGYETEEAYGGKEKTNSIRKNAKRNKTRKTSRANKKTKKGGKRKTRKNKLYF